MYGFMPPCGCEIEYSLDWDSFEKRTIKTVSAQEFEGWAFAPGQRVSFIQRGTKQKQEGYIVDLKPKGADVCITQDGVKETTNVSYGNKLKSVTARKSKITWKGAQRLYDKHTSKFSRRSNWPRDYSPPSHIPALKDYELRYHFGFKQAVGWCMYNSKIISLSVPYLQIVPANLVEDTILHEIAHAMVGPNYGHGPVWKAMAQHVGF